jgi:hypothetical protein
MDTRGTPAIVLGLMENQQGTYKLLSLSSPTKAIKMMAKRIKKKKTIIPLE